jgi:pimeloyl-ACP methyl ester carboxylesterase
VERASTGRIGHPPGRLHARADGSGPTVLCLHSSAGSGQQWQALAQSLAERFRVVCVDAHGHGRSAEPDPGLHVLAQDAAWLAPIVEQADAGVHLVGHSYGAALAIRLALAHPARVRSLALYEPVLFSLLDDPSVPAPAREEIVQVGRSIALWVQMRQPLRAARLFVDFWSGPGAWRALGARQQKVVAARLPVVADHFESLLGCGITLAHVARLRVPTLLMSGARSRRSALSLVNALVAAWPHADLLRFPDLGHLGPVTHGERVNRVIARFIERVEVGRREAAAPLAPVHRLTLVGA